MSRREQERSTTMTYCCVAPAHWAGRVRTRAPALMTHARMPAYCPLGASARTAHDWIRTEGIPLDVLERMRTAPTATALRSRPSAGTGRA